MSCYAKIRGFIKYKDRQSFDAAVELFRKEEMLNDRNLFEDGDGVISNVSPLAPETLTIEIPYCLYRNWVYYVDWKQVLAGAQDYKIVWSSTEELECQVLMPGMKSDYDLVKWGMKNAIPDGEDIPDEGCDDWSEILEGFRDEFFDQVY